MLAGNDRFGFALIQGLARTEQNALVVGGSGGLGSALVSALLTDDSFKRVHATSRQPAHSTVLQELSAQHPGKLQIHPLDLSCEASISDAANAVAESTRQIDLIINAAGLLHSQSRTEPRMPERRLDEVTTDTLTQNFQVNAIGPALVVKHFSHLLPRNSRAVVVNISARVGSIGDNRLGGWYGYRASKAAQNMLTRTIAIELARRHRQLICVSMHPGTVDTELSKPFQANVPAGSLFTAQQAATRMLDVIDGLTPADNGEFFAWDGQRIPW